MTNVTNIVLQVQSIAENYTHTVGLSLPWSGVADRMRAGARSWS